MQKVCDQDGCVEIIIYHKGRKPQFCKDCRRNRRLKSNQKWYQKNKHRWSEQYRKTFKQREHHITARNKQIKNNKYLDEYVDSIADSIEFIEEYREDQAYWSDYSVDKKK